jgi:hypothetical protein
LTYFIISLIWQWRKPFLVCIYNTRLFVIASLQQTVKQRGNQNSYVEEEQTSQWPKEKVQKDKQRSTKHTHKTKDRVIRTPL